MAGAMGGLVGRVQQTTRQFSLAQRTLALIGVAGLVLGAVALSAWLAKPTMTPLFSSISATDASAIVDQLDAEGVTYELADGGSTILVPTDKVYAMRLAVAAAGLPTASSDGAGYSLLDDMGMTSSEFQQQVTYQRALEGELAKTIGAINGVQAATVRLAQPEESVFVSETAAPTASVFVKTAPGQGLDADKVQSIVHLVSAGIEGMSPTDVAVIDADGHVLSAVGGEGSTGLTSNQAAEYETRIASNVQAMLDRIVGTGNAVVSVTADLDYDETATTTETFSSTDGALPLSQATTREEYTGTGAAVGGVLGPDSTTTTAGTSGDGSYLKETDTVNNAVNRVVEEVTAAPGAVRRQSISVVVSDEAGANLDLTALEEAVVAAAGVDTTRGDVVSVSRMAFDTSSAEAAQEAIAAAEEEARAAQTTDLIKSGGIGAVVLIAFVLALVMGLRRSKSAKRDAIDLGELDLLEAKRAELEASTVRALPAGPAQTADPMVAKREDVLALAAEQPAEVAEVLRGWLVGGRR